MAKDQMAPNASPGGVSKKTGVRRVNNVPVFLLGAVLIGFVVIMVMVAEDRAAKQGAAADAGKDPGGNASMFAQKIVGNRDDGFVPPPAPPPKPRDIPPPEVVKPANPIALPPPSQDDAEGKRIRMAKLQMFDAAVKAKTSVSRGTAHGGASAPGGANPGVAQTRAEKLARIADGQAQIDAQRGNNPTAAYKAQLAGVGGMGGAGSADATPQLLQTSGQSGQGDRWRLDSQMQAPRTPYELRAGFVVPAILLSGINSDLPGQILAQVAQDVYDTPTGRYLLIPQGSRLVGSYDSGMAFGQERLLVAWQRIVFPDGKAFDIGEMPGSDSAGYAGLHDKVNNHYFRAYSNAFLMSLVTGGTAYMASSFDNSKPRYDAYGNPRPTLGDEMAQALATQMSQVTLRLLEKNLNIAPTLEIRPGYRFNVVVTKDMTFSKPYRSFDY